VRNHRSGVSRPPVFPHGRLFISPASLNSPAPLIFTLYFREKRAQARRQFCRWILAAKFSPDLLHRKAPVGLGFFFSSLSHVGHRTFGAPQTANRGTLRLLPDNSEWLRLGLSRSGEPAIGGYSFIVLDDVESRRRNSSENGLRSSSSAFRSCPTS
jgi:hypothetical protein